MKKRLLSAFLCAAMLVTMIPAAFASDLDGHWSKNFIEYLDAEGIINPSATTGKYEPERKVTRAEFMRYVNRAFHFTEKAGISYSDVQSNSWYYDTVRIAEKYGYINGTGNGRMNPEGYVTREQAAVILGRLYKANPGNVKYKTPQLEHILDVTNGCIVYQEQVMQIVQELAGYTMGQADNIRRAMSKKKQYVIDAERQNFVYGNEEQGIKGCIANGISEQAANKIYDSMVDFAKYAFNKSHAAAYAVVSYQTAYFKYYYPVEFMAALMTSVIDNTRKVSEYIFTCRQMGIKVLPPDVNEGEGVFTSVGDNIRYGLYAIKSIGRPVVDLILQERTENGTYKTLQSFLERVSCREVNKRAVENLIKAGALDGLDGNRQQMITVFSTIMDNLASEKKKSMSGQMTLFDLVPEEEKQDYEIRLPQLEEYSKEIKLGFEKEVLGIYLTGHPLEEYEERWRKNISAVTTDFVLDEETNEVKVKDNQKVTVGGMITEKTIKYTKNNKVMAFLTLEDLVGTVEVIVFPNSYEKYSSLLNEDEKVFITGRANVEEDKNGKIICEQITSFDSVKRELWLQFSTKEEFEAKEQELYGKLHDSDGRDSVVIYISSIKAMKRLPNNYNICINQEIVNNLTNFLGENNVKVVEKSIEKRA